MLLSFVIIKDASNIIARTTTHGARRKHQKSFTSSFASSSSKKKKYHLQKKRPLKIDPPKKRRALFAPIFIMEKDKEEEKKTLKTGVVPVLKCVCFHGFSQNADAFRRRTGSIRTTKLKRKYEFVFLDAPHAVDGVFGEEDGLREEEERNANANAKAKNETVVDAKTTTNCSGHRSWWLAGENVESGATKATDAAWVRPAKSRKIVGLEDSVELVRETFVKTEGEVRALVGFSQGATFIALLRRKLPELFENVRNVVSIAGFDPLDEEAYAAADDDGKVGKGLIESKSLHVHGANDALVTRDRCDRLRDLFYDAENASMFEHEGGHGVPTSKQFREAFETFLLQDDGAETERETERDTER